MSAAPAPSPAEQAVIDRFGIFDEECATDAMRSRLYGWLSDRTSRADGSEWEHGALRIAADELLRIVK